MDKDNRLGIRISFGLCAVMAYAMAILVVWGNGPWQSLAVTAGPGVLYTIIACFPQVVPWIGRICEAFARA